LEHQLVPDRQGLMHSVLEEQQRLPKLQFGQKVPQRRTDHQRVDGTSSPALDNHWQRRNRWRLRVRPVPAGARTPEVLRHLETAMRDQLTDVFWFHDRWRIDRTRPLSFYTKESPTEPARLATVPTRLIATLPSGNSDSVETLRRILEIRPDARIDVLDPGDLPALPDDERIVRIPWDREAPPEHLDGLLKRIDESHPAPLDFALLLDGNPELAKASKALGLRSIIGCQVTGKPWTRTFPSPHDAAGWRELAEALAATPSSGAQ
jgi:hypothetical protein